LSKMDSIIFGYPDYALDSTTFGYLAYTTTFGNSVVSFIFGPD